MDEETLNNTVTRCGDQHIGGFILLERVDHQCWWACEWSAFFVRLVLSAGSYRSFLDARGYAITELSTCSLMQLSERLDLEGEYTEQRMVFVVPKSLLIAEPTYARWKNSLSAEPKLERNELQSIFRR